MANNSIVIGRADKITVVPDVNADILHIIVKDYSKVIAYTGKTNKEVFANAYYVKLTDRFTINFQLYGNKVPIVEEGIDL